MRRAIIAHLLSGKLYFSSRICSLANATSGLTAFSRFSTRCRTTVKAANAQRSAQHPPKSRDSTPSVIKEVEMWPHRGPDSSATDMPLIDSAASSRRASLQHSHMPNTGIDEEHVYVLTLNLTPSISVPLDQMREEYFPKHLNRTPAHITLFHALPHSQIDAIDADLKYITGRAKTYHISTGMPYRLRKGVAVLLGDGDKPSQHLREELRKKWVEWLSQQDRSSTGWHPHWTVMNKVEEEKKVQSAFNTLRRILFEDVHHGKAIGLDLWRYNGGDWDYVKMYPFRGLAGSSLKSPDAVETECEEKSKSRSTGLDRPERELKKSSSRIMMSEVWRTVTLGKKSAKQQIERY